MGAKLSQNCLNRTNENTDGRPADAGNRFNSPRDWGEKEFQGQVFAARITMNTKVGRLIKKRLEMCSAKTIIEVDGGVGRFHVI